MKNNRNFFANAVLLAVSNMLLRCVAISFNAYVSAKVGSESMGIFTLVMSVYGFAVTLACSGVNLAAVRLTAQRTAHLEENGADIISYKNTVRGVLRACSLYSIAFGFGTAILLYSLSRPIGAYLLGDVRTVPSLRVLTVSLPAISLSSALSGCFTALRKVYKNTIVSISEQFIKICIICTCLAAVLPYSDEPVEFACLVTVGGGALAEGMSLVINALLYFADNKRPIGAHVSEKREVGDKTTVGDVAGLALPVAVSAYARQGLSSAEHLSLPRGLRKSGLSPTEALSVIGELQGMAFPLILFPSALMTSAVGLLIPELARLCELGKYGERERVTRILMASSLMFSFGCTGLFLFFGREMGLAVYGSESVGNLICVAAPLIPVMYTDMAVDCVLKGIGEQLACMKINIIDSASSLMLVMLLVPIFGLRGYIASVYFCEILNFVLSLRLLGRSVGSIAISSRYIVAPMLISLFSLACVRLLVTYLNIDGSATAALFGAIYTSFAVIYGICRVHRQKDTANIQK